MSQDLDTIPFPVPKSTTKFVSEYILRKILPASQFFAQGTPYTKRELIRLLANRKLPRWQDLISSRGVPRLSSLPRRFVHSWNLQKRGVSCQDCFKCVHSCALNPLHSIQKRQVEKRQSERDSQVDLWNREVSDFYLLLDVHRSILLVPRQKMVTNNQQ